MPTLKRTILRTCLAVIILLPIAAFAHFIIFPQETRSILVGFSNFKKHGHLYCSAATPQSKIDSLQGLVQQAAMRNASFWGQSISNPAFIYCGNSAELSKYSINPSAPAVTYVKLGATIVLGPDAADADIIAHEISHAELYARIGFYKFNYAIPAWFKHGLAMQNDYRPYYSEDTLKARTGNLAHLQDIKSYTTDAQFYAGPLQQVMLNYMAAKHEIKNWYTSEKLNRFIKDFNSGKTFSEAYGE